MSLTIKGGKEPGRNDPCLCGSGLKFKQCHGDPVKKMICERVVSEKMIELIMVEKFKKKLITEEQYKAFLDKKNNPEPVEEREVEEMLNQTGLKRCTCGTPIPDNVESCMKCGGNDEEI